MHNQKKILWLCNGAFSDQEKKATGTWLQPLAEAIQKSGEYDIVNVSMRPGLKEMLSEKVGEIKQYLLPGESRLKFNIFKCFWTKKRCKEIRRIVDDEKPDIVHIWGTEGVWGTAYRKGYINANKVLLGVQGLKFAYVPYYYGGLSFWETLKCLGPVEILYPPMSLWGLKLGFYLHGKEEKKMIKAFHYVTGTTEWVKNQVETINPNIKYYYVKRMMRQEFYDLKESWHPHDFGKAPQIFTTSSGSVPYKGFHILIKAIYEIKKKYPNVQLNIAGHFIKIKGYSLYVRRMIKSLELENNIHFLGSIDAAEIIRQLQQADVCVIPSFIETYCNAFAESMYVGTPTVGSFNGAMSELAVKDKEALYYNSLDYVSCANCIGKILQSKELSMKLSDNGRHRRLVESGYDTILNDQLRVYRDLLIDD